MLLKWMKDLFGFYTLYGGGGGGGVQYSTTQNYSPEEAARRTRVMDEGERVYQNSRDRIAESSYPGSVPVGPSDPTQAAWQMLLGSIPNIQQLADSASGAVNRGMSEDILYAHSNPYLQSYMNAAIRPIQDQFLDAGGIMSGIRTDAGQLAGGQGMSSRQGIAEGIAASRAFREMGDISSRIASEGYGQGLTHQARMTALAPTVQQMQTMPGQVASAVGTQQEGYAQRMNDYEADSRIWDLEKEWGPLQNWANIVYGAGSSQSTAVSQGGGTRSNPAMNAIGLGAMGYGLGASMFPGMAAAGPIGLGAGALVGLLMS